MVYWRNKINIPSILNCPKKKMSNNHYKQIHFTKSLVSGLIREQFPAWASLVIEPVEHGGHDNRTFRLGEEMLIRLPSNESYAPQVLKEQKWLPILAKHLSHPISKPIAMGQPSNVYPWHWSIYQWLPGKSANLINLSDIKLKKLATDLAQFINELHQINSENAPKPGEHNYWRGAQLSVYDEETRQAIVNLQNIICPVRATIVWEKALCSRWTKKPVWLHGDLASGNILLNSNMQLSGVIDFGCMAVGDPACDLVIAWTLLKNKSRIVFQEKVNLDLATWERARGWALWKALITFNKFKGRASPNASKQLELVNDLLNMNKI
jgi:aminoglycoside phosphotransferase (APT) family kinase protein